MDKWINRHYLGHLMKIENTYLEKLGTGRLIAILTTGSKTWTDGISGFIKEGTKIIIVTGFVFYFLLSKGLLF